MATLDFARRRSQQRRRVDDRTGGREWEGGILNPIRHEIQYRIIRKKSKIQLLMQRITFPCTVLPSLYSCLPIGGHSGLYNRTKIFITRFSICTVGISETPYIYIHTHTHTLSWFIRFFLFFSLSLSPSPFPLKNFYIVASAVE